MTNTTNQSLIAEIQNNRRLFYKFALKACKRPEVAEDLLQQVICKLLSKPLTFEVLDDCKFIFTMIVQANWNYWRTNRKYKFANDMKPDDMGDDVFFDTIVQNKMGCSYENDLHYSLKLKDIRRASKLLPPGQQKAIVDALNGHDIGEELGTENVSFNPRYESLKTNKRLATQKLRDKFRE